jgi:two-component system, NarL family, response regulator DevR
MIRVMLVDDHPLVRAGLHALLRAEPGLVPVAAASDARAALREAARDRVDVAVVDHRLPDSSGLLLCHELRRGADGPRVLLYSAFAGEALAIPAVVAGAGGMVAKDAPVEELFAAIRTVARGGRHFPPVPAPALESAAQQIDPEDLPILGMLMDGSDAGEVAAVLQADEEEVRRRIRDMLGSLAQADG